MGFGFIPTVDGLGAASMNVGVNGAAFGVANFTTLNVYEALLAANKFSVGGVLYNGDQTLGSEAVNVFDGISEGESPTSPRFLGAMASSHPGTVFANKELPATTRRTPIPTT